MAGLLPVFLVLLVSVLLFRVRYVSFDLIPMLSAYVMKIGLPVFVFSNFIKMDLHGILNLPLFLSLTLASLALYAAYVIWARRKLPLWQAMIYGHGAVAGNSMLMGVAVWSPVFGSAIAPSVAQLVLFENIILLPLFMVLTGRDGQVLKRIYTNPFLLAIILVVILKTFFPPMPQFMLDAVDFIGRSAAPVAIFTVGGVLAKTKMQGYFFDAAITSFGKLIILPLLVFMLATLFGVSEINRQIMTLFTAIPNAAIFPIFGAQVEKEDFAGSVFIISYAFAFFTLFGWILLLS